MLVVSLIQLVYDRDLRLRCECIDHVGLKQSGELLSSSLSHVNHFLNPNYHPRSPGMVLYAEMVAGPHKNTMHSPSPDLTHEDNCR
jgi:hypothetical protein